MDRYGQTAVTWGPTGLVSRRAGVNGPLHRGGTMNRGGGDSQRIAMRVYSGLYQPRWL